MAQGETVPLKLSVLLFQEGDSCWVAQGLEYDVGAQGKTTDDALYELQRLLIGQIVIRKELGLPPFHEAVPPAPELYRRRFRQAKRVEKIPPRMSNDSHIGDCRIAA